MCGVSDTIDMIDRGKVCLCQADDEPNFYRSRPGNHNFPLISGEKRAPILDHSPTADNPVG